MERQTKARALVVALLVATFGIEPGHIVHLWNLGIVATGAGLMLAVRFAYKISSGIYYAFAGLPEDEREI